MNDLTICLAKHELKTIPFYDIILPYSEVFLSELKEINLSSDLENKLLESLLKELSFASEITLQEELNCFIENNEGDYQDFVKKTYSLLSIKYPVLDKILKAIVNNFLRHIKNIYSNFSKDFILIQKTFCINENVSIEDIDTSLGDGHGGEGTALITLSSDIKLIYKPRNINTTNSYNQFIDWINKKLNCNLKTIKSISYENYGWIEFVNYESVDSYDEFQEYYYKAGVLLATTFLLGSKDCHYENLIASGKNPVVIDHETIIQPVLSNQSITTWDEHLNIPSFSVLESMLIVNRNNGNSLQCPGYGLKGNNEVMDLESKVINPNTLESKRDSRFIFRKLIKENIPFYNDTLEFANDYGEFFVKGFSDAYDMFMKYKEELSSSNSPVLFFIEQDIRYVWRPTFIYYKILKYLRRASFMTSFEIYNEKLEGLLSKAYQKNGFDNYKFMLESEVKQMLNGDIPFFSLNSLDYHLKESESFKIFQYNPIDNIIERIKSLSTNHKNEQINYILKWLNT